MHDGDGIPRAPLSTRALIPWWFVGGAGVSLAATILLPWLQDQGWIVGAWGAVTGSLLVSAREEERNRAADGRPPVRRSPRAEAVLASLLLVLVIGLGILLSGSWPERHVDRMVVGAVLAMPAAAVLGVLLRRSRRPGP